MRQTGVVVILLVFLIGLLASLGGVLFLWQENGALTTMLEAKETNSGGAEATLVQVLAERQIEIGTRTALDGTQEAVDGVTQVLVMTQEAAVTALAAEVETLRRFVSANDAGTPEAVAQVEGPVAIRLWLENPLTTRQVGQPVNVIASAAHPDGIAGLNIAVNGDPLRIDSPIDPPLHTATVRFVPRVAGEYRFTALATTARGRASETAALVITVVDVGEDINSEIRRKIEEQVLELRQLKLLDPIFPTVLNRFELAERLESNALAALDPETLAQRSIALSAFDFVPPGYDLYEASIATLSGAVAGYYEPETDELLVVSDGEIMSQEEQLTFAHELMHALQDQHFQLALVRNDRLSSDAQLAVRALGEGEAELIEFLYEARGFLTGEELGEDELLYGTPDFAGVYDFLVNDFNFPYTRGYDFVDFLFQREGFDGITAAWDRLPQSTEHILHPEKYLAEEAPITVTVPELTNILDDSWMLVEADVLGEFYLREYLALQLDSQTASAAAAGWGGDYYRVYYQADSGAVLLVLRLAWDSADELDEFTSAFGLFADRRSGGATFQPFGENGRCWETGDVLCLVVNDQETVVVRSPNASLLEAVLQEITR